MKNINTKKGNKAQKFCNPSLWVLKCWHVVVFISISVIQWLRARFLVRNLHHVTLYFIMLHTPTLQTRTFPTLHTCLVGNIVLATGRG